MSTRLTTDDLPERQRFAYWQSLVCETFVEFDCARSSTAPFFGEISSRAAGDVHFTRVHSRDHLVKRGEQEIRRSGKESILLHVQLAGSGIMTQDGRDVRLKPGEVAFFDSTRPSSLVFDEEFELLVVHLQRAVLTKTIGRTERYTAQALNTNSHLGSLLADHLRTTSNVLRSAGDATARKLGEIALGLIGATVTSMAGTPADQTWSRTVLIYRAKAYAEHRIGDANIGPQQVATALGISARYLQGLFQAEGTTFSDWIWKRRLELCAHRLANSADAGCNIGQIAFEYGFSDFSHFSRRFRLAFGECPRDFRTLAQQRGNNKMVGMNDV